MFEQYKKTPERPLLNDSLALQTYEFFNGDAWRDTELDTFKRGKTSELRISYPYLDDDTVIKQHISNLEQEFAKSTAQGSLTAEYRLAEAYLLQAAHDINSKQPTQAQIDHFQLLNSEIYGTVDKELFMASLQVLWEKLEKSVTSVTQRAFNELKEGYIAASEDGKFLEIPPLPHLESDKALKLPELTEEASIWVSAVLETELAPAKKVITEYAQRHGEEFEPRMIYEIFPQAFTASGLDIGVDFDKDASALSWSSAKNSVVIGGKRKTVKGQDALVGLLAHEGFVHGRRAQNGLEAQDSSLANGLFTEADYEDGEDPSYLTFEEGLAAVIQKAAQGKREQWNVASVGNYVNIGLAAQGFTSRQVFEVMSRVRTILSHKGKQVFDAQIGEKARDNTLRQVVRTFRGTPVDKSYRTSDGVTLHYAKDLAYLAGKVKAIRYLNEVALLPSESRESTWKRLFAGKYDPTNKAQYAYVESRLGVL